MSIINVIGSMFSSLFSSGSGMFAIGALLAVLLGWGIYELLCLIGIIPNY